MRKVLCAQADCSCACSHSHGGVCQTEANNPDFSYPLNWQSVIYYHFKNLLKNLLTKEKNSPLKLERIFQGIFLSVTNVEIIPFEVSVRSTFDLINDWLAYGF